jgi:hypothetical protein
MNVVYEKWRLRSTPQDNPKTPVQYPFEGQSEISQIWWPSLIADNTAIHPVDRDPCGSRCLATRQSCATRSNGPFTVPRSQDRVETTSSKTFQIGGIRDALYPTPRCMIP